MSEKISHDESLIHKLNSWSQHKRGKFFLPLLVFLCRLHLSANMLTNLRFVASFTIPALYIYNPTYTLALLIFLYLTDAVDGALARHQNKANDRGKFLDICADTALYAAILFIISMTNTSLALSVLYNLAIVTSAYILSIIHKEEFRKSDWIIKPYPKLLYLKALVVVPFFLWAYGGLTYINLGIYSSNILATVLVFYFWYKIQKRWHIVYDKS